MRETVLAVILLTLAWSTIGCTTEAKPTTVDPRDQQIQELKKRLAALENKPKEHHYELRNEGTRSFRFDPETGESCIQLASKADWKNKDTTRQSCAYTDYIAEGHSWADTQCSFFLEQCDHATWVKNLQ